ncbi:MAG: PIG-L family deacetylase, partial [Gemmatimonadota bacterium]
MSLLGKPLRVAALLASTGVAATSLNAQLTPPSTGGVVALDHLLQRLAENRRVLVIAAHPDDEDTSLLTLMARGYGAEAAYLSLSRGEGGQNLIGEELGIELGLLRSRELEAARQVDGARQFFTRSYDFGYSRSLSETSRFWLPDSVLKDAVRIVRRFKPHVIVTVFSGTSRDGHGQHHAAGSVARPAFEDAGDPALFPELQTEEGLEPWTPLKLYRSTRFDAGATTVELPTGVLDPRTGMTLHQIAMESRSQHSSQDMGRILPIGPATTRLMLIQDRTGFNETAEEQDIFDGIPRDSSWLTELADSLRHAMSPARLTEAVPALASALARVGDLPVDDQKARLLREALAVSAGLVIDGRADSETLVAGEQSVITVQFYNAGPYQVVLEDISLVTPDGWMVASQAQGGATIQPGDQIETELVVTLDQDAQLSQPYFLQRPMVGSQYDWSGTPPDVRGLP